jgi:hypothetical protein
MCCLILLLSIYPLSGYRRLLTYDEKFLSVAWDVREGLETELSDNCVASDDTKQDLTPMEALDLVKGKYAANFEKIEETAEKENYYYKLPIADYYLVYEGKGETEQQYLFHLYEYVPGDPENGIGHTVTYGWYQVDKVTAEIIVVD